MNEKAAGTVAASSAVSAIICVGCFVIHAISIYHVGVLSDEFGQFSSVGFYGSDGLNTGYMVALGLYFLIVIGSCYASKKGKLFNGVLFVIGLLTLVISSSVLYYNIQFLSSFQLSLADAYGGKVMAFLLLVKIFLTLVCCVLLAIILGMKFKYGTAKNK